MLGSIRGSLYSRKSKKIFLIRTRITGRPRTLRVLLGPGRTGLELIGRHVQLSRVVESIVDLPRKRRVSELELVEVKPSGRPVIKSSRRFELAVSCLEVKRVSVIHLQRVPSPISRRRVESGRSVLRSVYAASIWSSDAYE